MPNKIKIFLSYLIRVFWTTFGAFAFWLLTFFVIWDFTGENVFLAYILNGVTILYVTIEDKLRLDYLHKRKKALFKNKYLANLFDYIFLDKYDLSSMKSSLYLFYIIALVTSHMLMINPYIEVSESVRSYFTTVGYGLVILMAVDKFVGQFMKDDKRIKDYYKKQS